MRVLLVDDEKYIRDEFKYFMDKFEGVEVCGETGDPEDVIPMVRDLKPDLVFLDINLQTQSGLVIAREILDLENPPQIVLATAFDQYAVKGFDIGVVDYIVKPIMEERLKRCIDRARQNMDIRTGVVKKEATASKPSAGKKMTSIAVAKNDKLFLLKLKEIVYLEYFEGKIRVFTEKDEYSINQTMKAFMEENGDGFIRTHKSFIVNIDYIEEIIPWFNYTLKLRIKDFDELEIPVSRNYMKDFKEKLKI
ncbi:two component transcriptional regulator, LytTR family [Dethiosulfatibacter aminovorans DSM 17477]|uniref:Two component transcriptional regulator, LytTR family n=1 Tax=Dethiosulfatibacter aminovorans DSM 17477 TaxID=1121476 RepID=A0A1M6J024_9FIRM|nr:LytTR family DNA-binding domain-containing protein [Dethiosulfatibacter aminovorans]SHJ40007.1 two component transcriptional regulator, LytTR family [Dethiosulfatibacter aminovorans DSM 17477]